MKQGKSIVELATEIQRQAETKRDFISDTRELSLQYSHFSGKPAEFSLEIPGELELFDINQHTHRQIGDRVGIPAKYYDRMRSEAPELLLDNVEHWFKEKPERRLIRTMDSNARAFLSDRYRIMDNDQIANAVLPILGEIDGLRVLSTEITDNRMYIKAVNERIESDVVVGDTVQAGVVISNSEIGAGAFKVEPLVYRLVCMNGQIINSMANKAYHTGKRAAAEDSAYEIYRDETLAVDDKAFYMKAQDLVRAAIADIQGFNTIVNSWQEAKGRKIINPVKAVEVVSKRYSLNEGEQGGVLRHLIEGADLSAYGMMNAVTRTSQDVDSYDRATELERTGPSIIDLPASQWNEIGEAA